MDSERILDALYAPTLRYRLVGWALRLLPPWGGRRRRKARLFYVSHRSQHVGYKITGAFLLSIWLVGYLYYYNELVNLESNVDGTWAQIEALQQKRAHIRENLTILTNRYSRHEEAMLTRLTELRTGVSPAELTAPAAAPADALACSNAPPAAPPPASARAAAAPADLPELLGRVHIVGEQYPDLHLTENVQQFATSIMTSETDVAKAIMDYNDAVNIYTTALDQFPGNMYGYLAGFRRRDFYEPEDRRALRFHPVSM